MLFILTYANPHHTCEPISHCCGIIICRDNVEDALEKLQAAIDGAVESIQPIEIDPEKQKQMKKQ